MEQNMNNETELKMMQKARKGLVDVLDLLLSKKREFSHSAYYDSIINTTKAIIDASEEDIVKKLEPEIVLQQAAAIVEQTIVIREIYNLAFNQKRLSHECK